MENVNTYWFKPAEYQKNETELFYFRKEIEGEKSSYVVHITADSRYKLFVNGTLVENGPAKGNHMVWYYDEIDLAPYLNRKRNVIAIEVLHYPAEHWKGNCGIFRTEMPGLYFREPETELGDYGNASEWMCKKVKEFQVVQENPYFSPLLIYEKRMGQKEDVVWKLPEEALEGCESLNWPEMGWKKAVSCSLDELSELLHPKNLILRGIPFLKRTGRCFEKSDFPKKVPANETAVLEFDAGELTTGFLRLFFAGGKDAKITILQSECYAGPVQEHKNPFKAMPVKGDRADKTLQLYGYSDCYELMGNGTKDRPEIYEPFWFRTFRYIRVTIETGREELCFLNFDYEEVGYPLEIKSHVETSDPSLSAIWDICERSLRRYMHETYEDCPFYEQLQYAMDARSQMLYTYAISMDDRLARNCMEDFRYSALYIQKMAEAYEKCQKSDTVRKNALKRFAGKAGLINSCYPNYEMNIIPGFSIYYIGMLYDHMMYFGDKDFLRRHMETVDGILHFFERNLDERGLVGKIGDINQNGNDWSFIDWAPEWDDTDGVPPCTKQGPVTMESFLYLLGLQYAEKLAEYLCQKKREQEYREHAGKIQESIKRYCTGRNGMYQDGPGIESYSQHCQVFAILTDTVSIETGKNLLRETLEQKEDYPQCTIAMMFYLFRALEKCDLYDKTEELWDIWRMMVKNHMTTCAEDPVRSRSDCHAWGALALYELPVVVLGVRPKKPGFTEYEIRPHAGRLKWARGEAATREGMIGVSWEKNADGKITLLTHKE